MRPPKTVHYTNDSDFTIHIIMNFLPIKHVIPDTFNFQFHNLDDYSTKYYIIWEHMNISVIEAQKRCETVGGLLPMPVSQEDISTIETLVMGTHTNKPFLSSFRLFPLMGIFLGFNGSSVSMIIKYFLNKTDNFSLIYFFFSDKS